MRVIAARPTEGRNASAERTRLGRAIAVSTVSLALVDPAAARTVLEQLESRARVRPCRRVEHPRAVADRLGPG